jgi:hypothetical protein
LKLPKQSQVNFEHVRPNIPSRKDQNIQHRLFSIQKQKGLGRQKQTASISNPTSIKEVETVYSTNKETAGSKASRNKDHCSNSYSWKNTWSVS